MRNPGPPLGRFPFDTRQAPMEESGCGPRSGGVPRPRHRAIATWVGRRRVPTSSVVGRVAAVLALIGAVFVVLLLVLGGGSPYTITAQFESASQLVTGNNVNVAGVPVGSIKEISLADDGQAEVEMEISDGSYTPLPEGTNAEIRSQSLSGIANRYVSLELPAEDTDQTIEDGGVISQENTTAEV